MSSPKLPRWRLGTFSNVLSLTGAEAFARLVGFVLVPYLSRALGPAGWTSYEAALGTFLIALSAVRGFEVVTMRRVARSTRGVDRITGLALVVALVWAVPSVLAMLAWAWVAADGDVTLRHATAVFAAALFVVPWGFRFALIARHRAHELTKATVAGQLVYAALVFSFVRRPDDVLIAALAFVAGVVLTTEVVTFHAHVRGFAGPAAPDRRLFRAWFATSLPVVSARLLRNTMFTIDLPLLTALTGVAAAAPYTGPYKVAQIVMPVVLMLFAAGFAGFTRAVAEGRPQTAALVRRYWEVTLGALVPFALCVSGVAASLLGIVLGEAFAEGAPLLRVLVWKLPLIALSTSLRSVLWVMAPRSDLPFSAIGLAVLVGALLAAVAAGADPLLAAAWATVAGEAALLLGLLVWSRARGVVDVVPARAWWTRAALASALCGTSFALESLLPRPAALAVAIALGGLGVWICTGGHLREQWRQLAGRTDA